MKIVFVDPADCDYSVDTVYHQPLGGSQSAVCYLCQALVRRGHDVTLITSTSNPGTRYGVRCLSITETTPPVLQRLGADFCVAFNTPQISGQLRQWLGLGCLLLLWIQHDIDQPAAELLDDQPLRDSHDAFVFVSNWQKERYMRRFGIAGERAFVQRNAIAPMFENLFPPESRVDKPDPPVLAYTSTPFRGLDLLVELFPEVRRALPRVTLKVFSSMKVYQVDADDDRQAFGNLYDACRNTDGIEYVGAVPQPQLAKELKSVNVLAYPNTFAETSCIAVLEAMAAGCRVVTSQLGALPETTDGMATLVPTSHDPVAYKENFVRRLIHLLEAPIEAPIDTGVEAPADAADELRQQVDRVNREATWNVRAEEWEMCLSGLQDVLPSRQEAASHVLAAAIQHHQAGRMDQAAKQYQEVLAIEPNHPDALHLLGVMAHQIGRNDKAVEMIEQAIGLRGDVIQYHVNLAAVLAASQQWDEVARVCRRGLQSHADDAELSRHLAQAVAAGAK